MNSIRATHRLFLLFVLTLLTTTCLHAELPVDSSTWKARCILLSNNAANIQAGKTPAALIEATRGLPGPELYTMGVNRQEDGDHYVACTYYYMAAIAERAGNAGKHDYKAAYADTVLGAAELRMAHHQHLTMDQHVKRFEMKVNSASTTVTLGSDESAKVQLAGGTFPITLDVGNDPLLTPVATRR